MRGSWGISLRQHWPRGLLPSPSRCGLQARGTSSSDLSGEERNLGFCEEAPDVKMLAVTSNLVWPHGSQTNPSAGHTRLKGHPLATWGVLVRHLSHPRFPSLQLSVALPPTLPSGRSLPAHIRSSQPTLTFLWPPPRGKESSGEATGPSQVSAKAKAQPTVGAAALLLTAALWVRSGPAGN